MSKLAALSCSLKAQGEASKKNHPVSWIRGKVALKPTSKGEEATKEEIYESLSLFWLRLRKKGARDAK
jgi:hypothetical protein